MNHHLENNENVFQGRISTQVDVNPLVDLVYRCNFEEFSDVFLHYQDQINDTNHFGKTALIIAARIGKSDIVDFLIDHGADVNIADCDGTTALIAACLFDMSQADLERHHIRIAERLISANASIEIQNRFGQSPLMLAACAGSLELLKILLAAQITNRAHFINQQDESGNTALSMGAELGRFDIVKCLLAQKEIDVNIRNLNKETALMRAAVIHAESVVQLLLNHKNIDTSGIHILIDQKKCRSDIAQLIQNTDVHTRQCNLFMHIYIKVMCFLSMRSAFNGPVYPCVPKIDSWTDPFVWAHKTIQNFAQPAEEDRKALVRSSKQRVG